MTFIFETGSDISFIVGWTPRQGAVLCHKDCLCRYQKVAETDGDLSSTAMLEDFELRELLSTAAEEAEMDGRFMEKVLWLVYRACEGRWGNLEDVEKMSAQFVDCVLERANTDTFKRMKHK